jgi:pimeloyl-ACP methyl ester carboxylesterase
VQIIDRGSGPALVLIPGIQGRWEYLRPAIAALTRWCRVITFSLGDEPSARTDFDSNRGFAAYVTHVLRVLDDRRIDRAVICGISFGGLVALGFAAEYPDRTAALILVSTPAPGWHVRRRHDIYARFPYIFGPLFVAESPWRLRRELVAAIPDRRARWRFSASQAWTVVRAPLSLARIAKRARMIGSTGALSDCGRVTCPTLVVTGEPSLDYVVSAARSSEYVALVDGARGATLERTGHIGTITHPVEFSNLVQQFVGETNRRHPHHSEVA